MVKLGRVLAFFLILFVVGIQTSFAKDSLDAELLESNVEVGEQVHIILKLFSDTSMPKLDDDFKPPQLIGNGALDFSSQSSRTSTSIRIINGESKAEYRKDVTLTYGAYKEGEWTIPAFNVSSRVQKKAGPFKVKVYEELPDRFKNQQNSNNYRNRDQGGGGFESLFKKFFNENGRSGSNGSNAGNQSLKFFSKVEVDKTQVFKGEQLFAKFYIYTNGVITKFDTLKFPTLEGFWKEDVEFASRFDWEPVIVDGERYRRAVLCSYVLIPYTSGEHKIDSFDLRATVSASGFGFIRDSKVYKKKSEVIPIEVLPQKEKDEEMAQFKGGVGVFDLDLTEGLEKKVATQGDSVKLKLKVIGNRSSVKFVEAPDLDLGDEFKFLSVEEDYKFFPKKLSSLKTFTYNLIPLKKGVYKIPDVTLSFHKNFSEDLKPPYYYEITQEMPLYKIKEAINDPNLADEDYIDTKKEESLKPFEKTFVDSLAAFKIPMLVYHATLILGLLFGGFVMKKQLHVVTEEEQLKERLHTKTVFIKKCVEENEFTQACTEFINLNYLLAGGLTGKRSSNEEEYVKSLESLPAGLKSKKSYFLEIMRTSQYLRFGTDLSLKQNQDKFKKCVEDFQQLFKDIESYLKV